jgi:hypothetical protein
LKFTKAMNESGMASTRFDVRPRYLTNKAPIAMALIVCMTLPSCVTPRTELATLPAVCNFRPEGEIISVMCSDGSFFDGPASGGPVAGFDRHGNMLEGYITFTDGRYGITYQNSTVMQHSY